MIKKLKFDNDDISAFDAISDAQKIAFAPMLFQATMCLRDFGILAFLDEKGKTGALLSEITQAVSYSDYAVSLLLDMGLTGKLIYMNGESYCLGKTGWFLLHDEMTRVNLDFTQHLCYQGLFSLKESLENGKPEGLKVFGPWETIYPALSQLPEPAKTSWFNFDHFYSSGAFNAAASVIAEYSPSQLYDVGGNTGKWALICCEALPCINVTILDLPQQIALMKENIGTTAHHARIAGTAINILDESALPGAADIWWMSQFLDCFTPEQIVAILIKIRTAMKPGAKVAIMELFWDCQPYHAGAFSLNASSLYFTCMANGNSRFYALSEFKTLLHNAGFEIERTEHNLGVGHTLLICTQADK
ncbi:methyltransferase [Morganella psychrotolerans]|uniref:Methyltransferase n=1 Tax=Morganella psychrotolerans TaxID=368603 RepID=A0A1B8HPC6_9GAMM|nr:methyltransferase [Morganella psychrotolerans]OBU11094.1 methyltransferase [Morganella psychrotolerans]